MENTILRNQMDVHFEEMTALLDFDVQKYITNLQMLSIVNSIESSQETNEVSDFWDHLFVDLN
ncbi:hypothetical protein [Dokdonia pacifica]|uniref:Uncharacterized protein n=1 Tax=Dokdonia pacifica TaxID=1627892 RepID=A0A238W9P5_9FLAO|nr:hypothetical protein [Dokdonia pacifica]GGG13758.1 hypothetical protein GCM10011344_13060 [Dokdonia pacifica]SNR43260.1 hypothetical protein SAMN06265376_101844 [Dokdonia pacifica]